MSPEPTRDPFPFSQPNETLAPEGRNSRSKRDELRRKEPRVAIIGAGPAGLEAALYAKSLGMQSMIFERDPEIAPDIRAWSHLTMFTPWAENRTMLGVGAVSESGNTRNGRSSLPAASIYPTGAEFIDSYLAPIAKSVKGSLHLNTRVMAIGRTYLFTDSYEDTPERRESYRFRILTRSPLEERIFTADYIIDATGVSHTPNWAGSGGMPALGEMGGTHTIFHDVPDVLGRDRIHFLGKSTLLIGDGASAASTALMIAELQQIDPATSLRWATRTNGEMPIAIKPGDRLARRELLLKKANLLATSHSPNVEHLPLTQVEAIQHSIATGRFQVTLQVDRVTRRVAFDSVVANVGSRPDSQTFERILLSDEPGYFTIGAKAAAQEGGEFYLSCCPEQIRSVFAQITGNPTQNCYHADCEHSDSEAATELDTEANFAR